MHILYQKIIACIVELMIARDTQGYGKSVNLDYCGEDLKIYIYHSIKTYDS